MHAIRGIRRKLLPVGSDWEAFLLLEASLSNVEIMLTSRETWRLHLLAELRRHWLAQPSVFGSESSG